MSTMIVNNCSIAIIIFFTVAVSVNAQQKNSTRFRSSDGFAVNEIVDLEQITVKSVRNGFCARGHFFNQSRPYAVAILQYSTCIREALGKCFVDSRRVMHNAYSFVFPCSNVILMLFLSHLQTVPVL